MAANFLGSFLKLTPLKCAKVLLVLIFIVFSGHLINLLVEEDYSNLCADSRSFSSLNVFQSFFEKEKKSDPICEIETRTPSDAEILKRVDYVTRFNFTNKFDNYLEELGLSTISEEADLNITILNMTFVTAVSDDHAGESRKLVIGINSHFPKKVITVYDLGLSATNRKWFEIACNVNLKMFNFSYYPDCVRDLQEYRFKPIIVAQELKENPAVFWVDSSASFYPAKIERYFKKFHHHVKAIPEAPKIFIFTKTMHSTYAVTHPGMLKFIPFFSEEISKKRTQFEAGMAVYYRTKETISLALKWLVLCALEKECMAPTGQIKECVFRSPDTYGIYIGCHRHDQAALNLILSPWPSSFVPWMREVLYICREDAPEVELVC